tara:strand:- start:2495 stop:4162 length:1668 start_codon:yes stop_codon:yes gene_type:complete
MGIGAVGKLTVMFGADMKGFDRAMKTAQKSTKKFGNKMKGIGRTLSTNLVLPMVAFAAASIKAFDTQIKAETKLLTALKGKAEIQKRLIAQAQELQQKTLFGDEETIAAQAMLATMGLEENAIKKLIPLVQDMAVAKGMDLVQAADLVAKSVGSSTNALSRYGIEITGAVGSTERLETAVDALTQMFLGQAEAIAQEGLGAWIQLQMTLGDVGEKFGEVILDGMIPLMNNITSLAKKLQSLTKEQREAIVQWGAVAIGITAVITVIGLLAAAISALIGLIASVPFDLLLAGISALGLGVMYLVDKFKGKGELNESIKEADKEISNLIVSFDKFGKIKIKPFRFFEHTPTTTKKTAAGKTPKSSSKSGDQFSLAPQGVETGWLWNMSAVEDQYKDVITWNIELSEAQKKVAELNMEIRENFEGALYGAMTAQENFFDSFIANMKKAIGQMMAMHAAQQITNALFGVATGGLGGGIGGIFGKLLGLHTGGLVTGPTLAMVGEGGGTSISNPEVVAPLDKLKSMMGGGVQQIEVQGRLSGSDIWLSNSKTTNSRLRSV